MQLSMTSFLLTSPRGQTTSRLNMKQFFTFAEKEFYHVFSRSQRTLPCCLGFNCADLLFGFCATEIESGFQNCVVDYANASIKESSKKACFASDRFGTSALSDESSGDSKPAFKKGIVNLAVVFPAISIQIFWHKTQHRSKWIADASDPNKSQFIGPLMSITISFGIYQQERCGMNHKQTLFKSKAKIRMLYNPIKGATNFVPGVIALVLC